jgi:hypothetical protein
MNQQQRQWFYCSNSMITTHCRIMTYTEYHEVELDGYKCYPHHQDTTVVLLSHQYSLSPSSSSLLQPSLTNNYDSQSLTNNHYSQSLTNNYDSLSLTDNHYN